MFKKAERKVIKIKGALVSPSGGGKTYSALLMAKGMAEEIAKFKNKDIKDIVVGVADSENESASLYCDSFGEFEFSITKISPPYTTDKYAQVVEYAENNGIDILIIDSLSHPWAGDGGILRQKEQLDSSKGGNQYTNWSKMTPKQENLMAKIVNANVHILATIRSKQAYVLEENAKGKQVPKKVGLAPVQREGIEYEFSFVLEIASNHYATVGKDRTGQFENLDEEAFIITEKHGQDLMKWIYSGKQMSASEILEAKERPFKKEKTDEILTLTKELTRKEWAPSRKMAWMVSYWGVSKYEELSNMSLKKLDSIISTLRSMAGIIDNNKNTETETMEETPF